MSSPTPPIPVGTYDHQRPFVMGINWDRKTGTTTAKIVYQGAPIFFGHSTAEVAELRRELDRARESKYYWKQVAMIRAYGGGPQKLKTYLPRRFRIQLMVSRIKNCLFQLIHTKEKNNA